jgi:hypothetical protein
MAAIQQSKQPKAKSINIQSLQLGDGSLSFATYENKKLAPNKNTMHSSEP